MKIYLACFKQLLDNWSYGISSSCTLDNSEFQKFSFDSYWILSIKFVSLNANIFKKVKTLWQKDILKQEIYTYNFFLNVFFFHLNLINTNIFPHIIT